MTHRNVEIWRKRRESCPPVASFQTARWKCSRHASEQ